jgi:DUF2075 family protein
VNPLIAYLETVERFVGDVSTGLIATIIEDGFHTSFGQRTSPSEKRSWEHSLVALSNVLNNPDIPDHMGVAVEFRLPKTSKRIDVILSGLSEDDLPSVVIIELKQWNRAEITQLDGIVNTFVGGANRNVSHPSYQAWSYAQLIQDFAKVVEDSGMKVNACAYLHNMASIGDLNDIHYERYTSKAPIFTGTGGYQLQQFILSHIQNGDYGNAIKLLKNSEISPSKSLADALKLMLEEKEEFILLDEQKVVFEQCLEMSQFSSKKQVAIIRGGPGTGKSVLAINLLSRFSGRGMNTRYITKNAAPRAVYEARLSGHMKKSRISSLFTGSGSFVSTNKNEYDVLIVDEAHRLNAKSGIFSNKGENQIKEIIQSSRLSIFFIDEHQRIHMKDIGKEETVVHYANHFGAEISYADLTSQFRCDGSDDYLAWIDSLFTTQNGVQTEHPKHQFDFKIFDQPEQMFSAIKQKNTAGHKSRVVAGYCWDWVSKKDPTKMDIVLQNGAFQAKWNLTEHGSLWIEREESISEVGCIHTCQGLELDYIGVIIGPDLLAINGQITTDVSKRSKSDASIKGIKKLMKEAPQVGEEKGREIVLNTYRTLLTRGMKGCYVYCTDDGLKELLVA